MDPVIDPPMDTADELMSLYYAGPTEGRSCLREAAEELRRLENEVDKLRLIIDAARLELRMPTDPNCPNCDGEGIRRNGEGMHEWPCECKDLLHTATEFARNRVLAELANKAAFEKAHGHAEGEACKDGCPPVDLPF